VVAARIVVGGWGKAEVEYGDAILTQIGTLQRGIRTDRDSLNRQRVFADSVTWTFSAVGSLSRIRSLFHGSREIPSASQADRAGT
jgi:hypothetical protein